MKYNPFARFLLGALTFFFLLIAIKVHAQEAKIAENVIGHFDVVNMSIDSALNLIMEQSDFQIEADENIVGQVTLSLAAVDVEDLLHIILSANKLAYFKDFNKVRIMTAEEYLRTYEKPFEQIVQTKIFTLQHVKPSKFLESLNTLKSVNGKIYVDDKNNKLIVIDQEPSWKAIDSYLKLKDVALITQTFVLKNIRVAEVKAAVQTILTENLGRADFDETKNQLTVVDTSAKMKAVERFIEKLDGSTDDIGVDVKIMQVTLNDQHVMGIDWEAIVSNFKNIKFQGFSEERKPYQEGYLSFGSITGEDFVVLLDALDTVGIMEDVFDGEMVINDAQTTTINIKASDVSKFSKKEREERRLRKAEKIKYHISTVRLDDQSFKMTVQPEFSPSQGISKEASVEAVTLTIYTTDTVLIGGLFKNVTVDSTTKIPLLGDIPLLGIAFSYDGQKERKTEIITFLTPKIKASL